MAEDKSTTSGAIKVSKRVAIMSNAQNNCAELSSIELDSTTLTELLSGTKGRVKDAELCNSLQPGNRAISVNESGMITVNQDNIRENILHMFLYEATCDVFATLYSPSGQVGVYRIRAIGKKTEI